MTKKNDQLIALKAQADRLRSKLEMAESAVSSAEVAQADALAKGDEKAVDAAIEKMTRAVAEVSALSRSIELAAKEIECAQEAFQNDVEQSARDAVASQLAKEFSATEKALAQIDGTAAEFAKAVEVLRQSFAEDFPLAHFVRQFRGRRALDLDALVSAIAAEAIHSKAPQLFHNVETHADGFVHTLQRRGISFGEMTENANDEAMSGADAFDTIIGQKVQHYIASLRSGASDLIDVTTEVDAQGGHLMAEKTVTLSIKLPVSFVNAHGKHVEISAGKALVPLSIAGEMVESGRAHFTHPASDAEEAANLASQRKLSEILECESRLAGEGIGDKRTPHFGKIVAAEVA